MLQLKEQGGVHFSCGQNQKIPFHGLFLLRNQTETLATQATFIVIVFVGLLSWDQCSSFACYSSWRWVEFIDWWVVNTKQRACYSPFKSFSSESFSASSWGSLQLWGKKWSPYLWNHYCWGEETCCMRSSCLVKLTTQGSCYGRRCWPWCKTWSASTIHSRLCSISKL